MKHLLTLFTFFLVTSQDSGIRTIYHLSEVKKITQWKDRCGNGAFMILTNMNSFCVEESIEQIYNQVK